MTAVIRDVARQIKAVREKWNMTREDLSDVSGVSLRTISEFERDCSPFEVRVQTMFDLANALGCDLVIEVKFRSTKG